MASNRLWDDAEISTGQRPIRDGDMFKNYFPPSDFRDTVVIRNGSVKNTVDLMKKVVWKYKNDTAKLAGILKRPTKLETCRAIWQFVYDFIQYKLDTPGLEELRRPARSWDERKTGVDCDCMSIFCSTILTNLQIRHSFRITKYSKPSWQHVYVVIPDVVGYITLDGVLGRFNYEKPYSQKKDYEMNLTGIDIAVLSGVEDGASQNESDRIYSNAIMGTELLAAPNQEMLTGSNDPALDAATYNYLLHTRAVAAANPMILVAAGERNPAGFVQMLDYAISHWHTPQRKTALGILSGNEDEMNRKSGFTELVGGVDDVLLQGDDDLLGFDGLGKAKNGKKGFFKKIGSAIKNHIVRMNPLTIAARNGFLLALKLNIGKISEKIKWGYATPEQAAAKGISPTVVERAKNAIAKIEKLFVKIGGKSDNLRKAVLKSKKGKLSGIGLIEGLGEALGVAPVAAAVAAAVPIITAVLKIIKDSGLVKPGEKQSMQPSEDETPETPQEGAESNVFDSAAEPAPEAQEQVEGLGSFSTVQDFITNNPMIATAGAAALAYGLYTILSPSHSASGKRKASLAGPGKIRKKPPKKFTLK